MKPLGKKSVTIEASVAKEMAIEKANTGKDIYVLIREAWCAYRSAVPQAEPTPVVPVPFSGKGAKSNGTGGTISPVEVSSWAQEVEKIAASDDTDAQELVRLAIRVASRPRSEPRIGNAAPESSVLGEITAIARSTDAAADKESGAKQSAGAGGKSGSGARKPNL